MIQLNLLPDVKLEYIRAARTKRLVILGSIITGSTFALIAGLLAFNVMVVQGGHIDNLNADITKHKNELTGTEDINKILTIQNQLGSLPGLHEQKPEVSRMFGFIEQMTPQEVSLSDMTVDYEEGTIRLVGKSDLLSHINEYVDTLKFTNFYVTYRSDTGTAPSFLFGEIGEQPKPQEAENDDGDDILIHKVRGKAFGEVVLEDFARSDGEVTYEITLKFDPLLFDGTEAIQLEVPELVTTRSEVEKPENPLFQAAPESGEEDQ